MQGLIAEDSVKVRYKLISIFPHQLAMVVVLLNFIDEQVQREGNSIQILRMIAAVTQYSIDNDIVSRIEVEVDWVLKHLHADPLKVAFVFAYLLH